MTTIDIHKLKHIHFIGIGGIGISAIARMMLGEGRRVSGSDRSTSIVTDELVKLGATIHVGHHGDNITAGVDLVVHTNAIPADNPELVRAHEKKIPVLTYPQMLGLVSTNKYTIAISGTHGKTTTTAMVAKILKDCGLDPTVIVGSLLSDEKTNFILGKSKYLVVEADEYRRSFLNLRPSILIINNIDVDHLDYYKDLEDIQGAFLELAQSLPAGGFLICPATSPHVAPVAKKVSSTVIDYPTISKEGIVLELPGVHNISNAQAALGVAQALGIDRDKALAALAQFKGTWRRFEFKGEMPHGALVYDDYAHNPHKIRAALAGARERFPEKNIIAIFQPHLYSRTKLLLDEFAQSFSDADEICLVPIYAAREKDDGTITSEMLAEKIGEHQKKVSTFKSLEEVRGYMTIHEDSHTVVVTLGAGDINHLPGELVKPESFGKRKKVTH